MAQTIVNGGKSLKSPVNIKEANKIYVERFLNLHNFCFMFIDHELITLSQCSLPGTHNRLFHFSRLRAGSNPKKANENIKQRTLPGFINIPCVTTAGQHLAPGGVLPIMAYTGRLRPKGVPFSGFRYKKG